jgi:hypothetical protein
MDAAPVVSTPPSEAGGATVATPAPALLPGKLVIAPCTTPVPMGNATLCLSGMVRARGVYTGEYQIKVAPLFFANEKGRLSVEFSDDTLRKLMQGNLVNFNGTATTTGSGKTRAVNGAATPSGKNEGRLQMWFTADGRKKGFSSTYRFVERQ